MQVSPELRDFITRTMQDVVAKNTAAVLETYSREPNLVFIGTAPTEWWGSLAEMEPVMRAMVEGGSGTMPQDYQAQAWQEGTVGWSVYRWTARLPNGSTFLFRGSDVYHQEGGAWRCVQSHWSVGIPDEQVPSIAQPA